MKQQEELRNYRAVQNIAKLTIDYLQSHIKEGMSELEIANAANSYMHNKGIPSFWYYGVGSLVLVGNRTTLSISGRDYEPSNERVGRDDLVTVDLSPELDRYWGDFARSFVIGNGKVITDAKADSDKVKELFKGISIEKRLHGIFQEMTTHDMTFEQLYFAMNESIKELGYINLDFKGNLGHSIEKDKNDRIYIEEGCKTKLSDVRLFTFEPHIKKIDGMFGYKMEDIYFFHNGLLRKL